MTEKMKTVCVGRFLVDIPSQAEVILSREMIDGFDIDSVEEDEADFHKRVASREAEIAAVATSAAPKGIGGMLVARDLRVPGMTGRLLIHGRTRSYSMEGSRRVDDEWVLVEAYAHLGGVSFSLFMQYADMSDAQKAEALLARLRLREESEVPSAPGFCIARGIFIEPLPAHATEHIAMHVGFLEHPDVALALASLPGGDRDRSLLTRFAEMDTEASADELLRVTKLRTGKRSINGIEGEEVLERIRELNFATTYGFMWETQGVHGDPLHPFLSLELQGGISSRPSGKPVDTSLHEDAVLALWDRISSSVRPRPSGPPPGPAEPPEPPSPKLGTLATAGDICQQSGWWKCREGGPGVDVQGGTVQWIRKGDRMPQALLLPRQTLWQKLRGLQPSIVPSQPTTWKLVDKRLRPRTPVLVALASPGPATAPGDASAGSDSGAALGTQARTGEVCPASGWWRCGETHALDGTRWFPRGSTLPAATLQIPSGMFGRSVGPEVIQRRSIWHLMRHAEAERVALADSGAPGQVGPSTLA